MVEAMVTHFSEQGADSKEGQFDESHRREVEEFVRTFDWGADGKEDINAQFSKEEVERAIRQLDKHKATGMDKVHNRFLIEGGVALVRALTDIFNESWHRGHLPSCWKMGNSPDTETSCDVLIE